MYGTWFKDRISEAETRVTRVVPYLMMWAVPCFVMVSGVLLLDKKRNIPVSRLLTRFIDRCRERGAAKIFLEVRSANVPARSLYEKHGFVQISVRRGYYGDDDAEFDKDSYFNAGWYIGHPIFVLTNASLGDEFVANFSNIFMAGDIEDLFSYPDKIARTSFVSSYMTLLSGNNMGYFISQDDIEDIEGAFVDYEVAELQYNLKSVLWTAVYFCGGYALFRKKNIF